MRRYHDSISGQLLKIQGLYQAKNRAAYSQEIAEGPQSAREALTWAGDRVRDIVVTEDALDRHPDIARLAEPHWTHVVPAKVLGQITADSQGVLVVLNTAPVPAVEKVLAGASLAILAVEMQDPGNGEVLQTRCFSRMKYGGGNQWRFKEDIYDPMKVRTMLGRWRDIDQQRRSGRG